MPFFCHQVRYTTDGWTRSLHNSQDRFEAVRTPIVKLGGSLRATYFTSGPFDVLAISEFPQEISPNAISVAFSDGGSVATIASTALLTATEAVSTWGKSGATASQSQALQKSKTAATGH
jgi:uncharacterized protein with GYD domain